jgi:general secretion pathway protein G
VAIETRQRRRRSAFTLVELLIVLAILLTIGGIVVVNLLPKKGEADISATQAQIDQFVNALDFFQLDMKRYPTTEEGLAALWSKDALEDEEEAASWKGPYLKDRTDKDLWGSEWIYRAPSEIREGAPFDIISIGPDKEEDTEDDIDNHFRARNEEGEFDDEGFDFGAEDEFSE